MSNNPSMQSVEQQTSNVEAAPKKRVSKKRLWLKILGIFFAVLLVLISVVIIWLGPIVESYIEGNAKDIVGRRIEMDNLSLKLFTGAMTADNVILYEEDGATPFASIDHIDVDMEVSEILSGRIHLAHVHLTRPYLSVTQNGEVFNFDDMVEFIFVKYVIPSMMEEDVEEDDDPWEIIIDDVTIVDGHIEYYDEEIDQRWSITALNMHADEFKMGDAFSYIDTSLKLNDRAMVDGILALNYDSFDFDFQGTIQEFDIAETYKYWTPYLNVESVGGILGAEAHVVGNIDNIFAMDISGSFDVDDLSIVGTDVGNLFSSKTLGGDIKQINIETEKYLFNTLYANDYATQYIYNADGTTNFDNLFVEDSEVEVESLSDAADSYDVHDMVTITPAEAAEPIVMEVRVDKLSFENGNVEYYDGELDQRWSITAMDVYSDDFTMSDEFSHFDASLKLNEKSSVEGALALNWESFDFDFVGTIKEFDISDTYNYWTPYLNVERVGGVAEFDAHLKGDLDDIFAMDIAGNFLINNLSIIGPDGGNVLSSSSLSGDIEQLNIETEKYIFNTLYAKGYTSQFIFNSDGSTNFDTLFPEDTQLSVETTAESLGNDIYDVREEVRITTSDSELLSTMDIRIGTLKLEDGSVHYADNTLHKDFDYDVSDIDITAKELDLEGYNNIGIKALLPKQGSVAIRWEGALNDFYNQSIMATLNNVDIKSLEPYIESFTAFPVQSGNLTFRSMNVITNGELNGVNQLGTYNFKLGKKNRDMDVDFNLPLRMGVYVLTDKDGHIDLDLPVTGNIESPEFSYRKTLLRVIGNLFLKIAVSPFDWMTGDKQEAFRNINFDVLDPALTSEHYARLDKMAETLKGDEELCVRLKQTINYRQASQDVANLNLKMAYYNSTQSEDDKRLDMLDFAKISDMRLSNSDIHAFADSMLVARNIDPQNMSMAAKARALYGEYVDNQLVVMAEYRNRIISEYIKFQHPDLREGAITIDAITKDDIVNGTGKRNRYTVTLVIDGEEMEMTSPEDEESDSQDSAPEEAIVEDEDNNIAEETLEGDKE